MSVEPGNQDSSQTKKDYLNCPHCGCPNKPNDTICSFCDAALNEKPPLPVLLREYVESLKWRYKLKSPGSSPSQVVKEKAGSVLTVLLGLVMGVIGGWFFLRAMATGGFADFIIGAVFALYGAFAIINTLKPNRGA